MGNTILFEKQGKTAIVEHFHSSNPISDSNGKFSLKSKYGYFRPRGEETISDDDIKKYYPDISKRLTIVTSYVQVVQDGVKVSIRFKYIVRARQAGGRYFKVSRTTSFVTYNTKTKNFYSGRIDRKNKKIKVKKIRCNQFRTPFLTDLKLSIRRTFNYFKSKTGSWQDMISSNAEHGSYGDEVSYNAIEQFAYAIFNKNRILFDYKSNHLENQLYKLYLKDNNISYPDTVAQYSVIQIPKIDMKKEGNIVNCFMNSNKIRGRHARTILNQNKDIDFHTLNEVYHNFGLDYFNKIRKSFFSRSTDGMYNAWFNMIDVKINSTKYEISKNDKKRIINLINNCNDIEWSLIKNHLYMIQELTKFDDIFKMRFMNRQDFDNEHFELTELLEKYREGKIVRIYNNEFVSEIEEPIYGYDVDYYPVILKTSAQYTEESKTQSNCVRTYIENPDCFIISLREGSLYSQNRTTIEYRINKNSLDRVQTRGRFNSNLNEVWDVPLEILDNRVNTLYSKNKFDLPKLIKEFTNGKRIERYAIFPDDDNKMKFLHPVWNEKIPNASSSQIEFFGQVQNDFENYDLPF